MTDTDTAPHLLCQLCHEPGQLIDGLFVHTFTGKPCCTYKSHL